MRLKHLYINLSPEVDFTSSFVPPPVEGILVFKASGADFKKYHAMTLRDSIETSKIHNKGTRSAGITATRDETIENKIEEYLQRKDNEQKLKEEEIAEEKSIEGRVIFNDKLETSSIESFRIVTKYLISRVPIADNPKFAEIQHTFEQFICDHSDLVLNKLLQIRPTMKSAFGLTSNRTREYKEIIDFITTTYKCNVSGKDFSGKIRAIEFTKLDALTMKDPRICGIPYGKSRDAEIRIADKKLSSYQTKPKVSSTILMEVEAISNLKIEDITPMDYIIHTGIQGSQASGNLICVLGMLVKYVKDNPSVKSIEDLDCKMCLQLKDSTDTNKYNIRRIYNNFLKNEKLHPVSMKIAEIIGENDLVYFNIRQGDDFVDDVAEMLRTCLNDRLSFSKVRVRFGGANGVSSLMGLYDAQCPSIENKGGRQVEITGNGEYRSFKLNFLNKRREILVATGSDVINQLRSLGLSKRLRNDGLRTEDALRMFDINNF